MKRPESKAIIFIILYGAILSALLFLFAYHTVEPANKIQYTTSKISSPYFSHIAISAKSVYVLDTVNNNVLYSKNEHIPLPIASITKVMTALCALDKVGNDTIIQIEDSDIGSTTRSSLKSGEKWQASDLASIMLVQSSNDAAMALGRVYGGSPAIVACMNNLAEKLELFETKFSNETGLDIGDSPGAYSSAENVGRLFEAAISKYPDIFGKTALKSYNVTSASGVAHIADNTDKAIDTLPLLLASKTGLTDLAGGNLVFAMNVGLNHTVIVVILGSTEDGRFFDATTLSNAVVHTLADNN